MSLLTLKEPNGFKSRSSPGGADIGKNKPCFTASMTTKRREKEEKSSTLLGRDHSSSKAVLVDGVSTMSIDQRNPLPEPEVENTKVESSCNWAKKYQPKSLRDFICHRKKADMVRSLVCSGHVDHFIFQGPPGVGKRTMARAVLRQYLGLNLTNETREEVREFNLMQSPEINLAIEDYMNCGSRSEEGQIPSIQIKVKVSSQHIEIDLSDIKWYMDEVAIELLKEFHTNKQTRGWAIIVNDADRLSESSQLHIRKYLETCGGHYKVIFCCCDIFKLHHLMPACIIIQLLPPSDKEIVEVLNFISKHEDIELPVQLANIIAKKSKNCLQQAIRSFGATWRSNYPFKEDQPVMTGWEEELANAAKGIIEDQTPKGLFTFRQKLQILLKHNICPGFIFTTLVEELKKQLDDQSYPQLSQLYRAYAPDNQGNFRVNSPINHKGFTCEKLKMRVKPYLKIEEFVAMFMSLCKSSS